MSEPKPRRTLKEWVKKLGEVDIPAVANIVQRVNDLTADQDTIANQLGQVILEDATLTANVLRVANTVHYNRGNPPITTISRAIVLLGFEQIKEICISVTLIDSLVSQDSRDNLLDILAQSFHGAAQARSLGERFNEIGQEELFITALLFHLGEIAFWSSRDQVVDELGELLEAEEGAEERRSIVRGKLGFSFEELTRALAREWHFGDMLHTAIGEGESSSVLIQAVRYGEEISRAAKHGWESDECKSVTKRIAKFSRQSEDEVRATMLAAADEAAAVAATYGARRLCRLIPSSSGARKAKKEAEKQQSIQPDAQLQLQVLRELSTMVLEDFDINVLFQTVLEGLHRGVGLPRVALVLLDGRAGKFSVKYTLGDRDNLLREHFVFPCGKDSENLFAWVAHEHRRPVWINDETDARMRDRLTQEVRKLLPRQQFLAGPLSLGDRTIGLIYADSDKHGRDLKEEDFQAFQHFLHQANMGLTMLKR